MQLKLTIIFFFACTAFSHGSFAQEQSMPNSKVEIEASFPGGQGAWNKYITQQIQMHADEFKKRDVGTCVIRFIVD